MRPLQEWRLTLRRLFTIPPAQLRAALGAAWLALTLASALALAAALAMPPQSLFALAARCGMPGGHRQPCALCGMTRALVSLREGNLRGAWRANPAGAVLFPLLGLNAAAAAAVCLFRRKRGGEERPFSADADRNAHRGRPSCWS